MAKSTKVTVTSRVHEVLKLLLAGAEYSDIWQYASSHGWDVSERQTRRYIEMAHKRFAKATQRDRKQLLGRHLMQRRALYARAIKMGDLRTALQVLRDEAQLEGIYPPTKIAPTTPDGNEPYPGTVTLTRRQRVVKYLAAYFNKDEEQKSLIDQVSPRSYYRLPDTMLPLQMLSIMAMMYVIEQLDHVALLCNTFFGQCIEPDEDYELEFIAQVSAYRFQIGQEAWTMFTERLGVDGERLVEENHQGLMLRWYGMKICAVAPTAEELVAVAAKAGQSLDRNRLKTAKSLAQSWWEMFEKICPED